MVASPYIVFFDTFTHNGQNQESVDCVRFKSGVELLKICILPFGSVVESNLSDEPLLGATNPASFDITVYSNSQTNCIVLQNVAKYFFNEKTGINTIYFKKPIQSNFMLFRGMYSTLTIALFGLPSMSLSVQSLAPATNLSIPPPAIGLTIETVETTTSGFYAPNKIPEIQAEQKPDVSGNWQQCGVQTTSESYGKPQTMNICSLQSESDQSFVHPVTETEIEDKMNDSKVLNTETAGLYEDGEIQDVDYEEISSNEELFSEIDDGENLEIGDQQSNIEEINEFESQILSCQWRFNPFDLINQYTTGFTCEFHRIADPTLTLFQLHRWLLERASPSKDQVFSENEEIFHQNSNENEVESNINLLPPPDDWADASQSADVLVAMTKKYCSGSTTGFHEEWVETLDTIGSHLAQGLAFLHYTDQSLYQSVAETLQLWVYTGLNMNLALNQPNASYIVKHIMAGVNLAGLLTSTVNSEIASTLLYPISVEDSNDVNFTQIEDLQVQHLLLNLLESPLITTPLRLTICRALDQTTRLPIGLNAFLGITQIDPGQKDEANENSDSFHSKSFKKDADSDEIDCSSAIKTNDNERCNGEMKWDDCTDKEEQINSNDSNNDAQLFGRDIPSNEIQSPYQRFIFIVSCSKNSRVTAAYERLLNKVHTYELLLEFPKLVKRFQIIIEQYTSSENGSLIKILELEQILVNHLKKLKDILQNAEQILANPRSSLPCPLLLNDSKRISHNPYADLCSMLDSCNLINSLTTLISQLTSINEDFLRENELNNQYEVNLSCLTCQIQVSIHELVCTLCSHSSGLLFLAFRPESTSLLIKACLQTFANIMLKETMGSSKTLASNSFILGLELIYKIEALRYLDLLIDWSRRKGMTGVYSFITQLQSDTNITVDLLRVNEANIRDALFGLTRLTLNSIGQFSNLLEMDSVNCLMSDNELFNVENVKEYVLTTLSTAAPIWIADVIAMDDYFAPLLMLIEAFSEYDLDTKCVGGYNTVNSMIKNEKLKSPGDDLKSNARPNTEQSTTNDPVETTNVLSSKATIRNLLSGPIQLSSLVNTLTITLLRHSENVSYLDRYGPRLAQFISPSHQADNVQDITPIDVLSQMTSFTRTIASYINWLRDGSSRSHVAGILNIPPDSPLSPESCSWLISQLQTMTGELSDALDTILGLEVADDLLVAPNTATSTSQMTYSGRRQPTQLSAGRFIPPSILLILRLLRTNILGSNDSLSVFDRLSDNSYSEQQIILSRTQLLIEIFSMNGLNTFITLVQKLSDFFILQLQATLSQANNTIDLIDISTCNSNINLIFSMFDSSTQIVSAILRTIIPIQGVDFQDTRILTPLFHAYACTIFAYCPPGPKAVQLERIRDSIIVGLLAYTHSELNRVLNVQEINKSLWVLMLKELIHFTISSPCFYLPGLLIFLDLLPLPLPIVTVQASFNANDESKINSSRDIWAAHLLAISSELTGMIQLLSATISSPNNLLFCNLFKFIERLADICCLPLASLLANACLHTISDIRNHMLNETEKEEKQSTECLLNDGDSLEKMCSKTGVNLSTNNYNHSVTELNSPSTKLLLNSQPMLDSRLTLDHDTGSDSRQIYPTINSIATINSQHINMKNTTNNSSNTNLIKFSIKQIESTELNAALSMLFILLKIPFYRYAVLDALRHQPINHHSENLGEELSNSESSSSGKVLRQNFLNVIDSVLSDYSDKTSHISVQIKLLQCLSLLVDVKLLTSNSKYINNVVKCSCDSVDEDEAQFIADNLPDLNLLKELVLILIKHINHPDRDMTTLPSALDPLIIITEHDPGFVIVKESLDSPTAFNNGQHLFANLVQRVNDCFSADNPDCQATLTGCLRLIQSLVTDHSTLPLTFMSKYTNWNECEELEGTLLNVQTDNQSVNEIGNLFTRQLHISGERVRELLGWSGNGDQGKPVRDLHALLEMLADDEPSLEYLRSGMKNLLSLLSHEYDIPELKEFTTTTTCSTVSAISENSSDELNLYKLRSKLPNARPLSVIIRDHQKFVKLSLNDNLGKAHNESKQLFENLSVAYDKISEDIDVELPLNGLKLIGNQMPVSISYQSDLVHCDLNDIATNSCNKMKIRDELAKYGHLQDTGEVAIRHQKRRRGQSSIIQTGTTFKKFVAPMRGRGFILRNTAPSNPASSNTAPTALGSTIGQLNLNMTGVRGDPFRSRPLNTSRPPSLHVDDFTKLEKEESIMEVRFFFSYSKQLLSLVLYS
ncbi:Protein virilizer isoform 2 [Schistosoma japonicum]|uniref:Protein virilizer isoform 2 n=1 Tax=Schistosoma japonicum TaxID=6182 RepID=A0A4Z2DVF0_SCHJA|nr:Protein virilizer isoform 2 [Schistosoma japonicum]